MPRMPRGLEMHPRLKFTIIPLSMLGRIDSGLRESTFQNGGRVLSRFTMLTSIVRLPLGKTRPQSLR